MSVELQNFPIVEPQLRDVIDRSKADTSRSINCVKLGTIESYDAPKNTATVSINFKCELNDGRVFDYPPLTDCPVIVLGGGASHLSFPIEKGDACIVLFNDLDIDNWYLSGKVDVPNTSRAHALSDGLVLVGVRPVNNPRTLASECLEMKTDKPLKLAGSTATLSAIAGVAKIEGTGVALDAKAGMVEIKNAATTLLTLLNTLLDTLAATTVMVAGTPTPLSSAAALTAFKTQLQTLLK